MITALWVAGVVLFIANIVVTIRLLLNGTYAVNQKLAQAAIVWFLPYVGALVVWHFLGNENEKPARRGSDSELEEMGSGNGHGPSRRRETEPFLGESSSDGGADGD